MNGERQKPFCFSSDLQAGAPASSLNAKRKMIDFKTLRSGRE